MASKITLFTRFLKAFQVAKDGVVPADASSAVELETGRNFGWKATKIPVPVAPVLSDITLSPATATVGEPYSGTVSGRASGSSLTLTGAGSAGLSIDSTSGAVTGTPSVAGTVNVVETLSGATGSPKTSADVLTVSE